MANRFQKMIFNLSAISPLVFFMMIVWWLQCGMDEIVTETGEIHFSIKPILISIIGVIGLLYAFRSIIVVKLANKKIEIVTISANTVKSKGNIMVPGIRTKDLKKIVNMV